MNSTPDDNPPEVDQPRERPESAGAPSIDLKISADRSEASVIIPERFDPDALEVGLVTRCISERGVILDEENHGLVEQLVESFRDDPRRIEEIIARSTPPVDGKDGRLEWMPGFDPNEEAVPAEPDDPKAPVDFYSQVSYIGVRAGDHVATLIAPTTGEDGQDVTGAALTARPGKAVDVRIDESLTVDDDGHVIAQTAGVLEFNDRTLAIARLMEVPEYVDFSTGNIDFDGSVHVREGVRDRFVVKATENLAVDGLVEGATVITGGDFHCRRGMAAKDRGQILVGGDAHVGYLNNVRGRVRGHLFVRRELMDCELIVGKSLSSSQGAIVGGRVIVTGPAEIATLGSPGGTPTLLVLGEVPLVAVHVHRLDQMILAFRAELERLREGGDGSGAGGAMRHVTAVQNRITRLQHAIDRCGQKRAELAERIPDARTVQLLVNKAIWSKSRLRIAGREFAFDGDVKGPLRIEWGGRRQIICRRGDGAETPLFDLARETGIAA
ncbi:MAG: FapA family protein [Planctomycetota bacterium]|nr:FapA family protein [Planctomycetota bacterium]